MVCEFSSAVNFAGEIPVEGEPFQFQFANCSVSDVYTLIQNPTTGAEFYAEKTLSYGDLLLLAFLSIFLIYGIFKFLWNFIFSGFKGKQL